MLDPVGARMASSSKVRHSPPAFVILARAVVVNLRAAMESFGTLMSLLSSVMVPTIATVRSAFDASFGSVICRAMLEIETGGLLTFDMKSLLRMTLLNLESVRLARNRYSFTSSLRYTLSDFGAVLCPFFTSNFEVNRGTNLVYNRTAYGACQYRYPLLVYGMGRKLSSGRKDEVGCILALLTGDSHPSTVCKVKIQVSLLNILRTPAYSTVLIPKVSSSETV